MVVDHLGLSILKPNFFTNSKLIMLWLAPESNMVDTDPPFPYLSDIGSSIKGIDSESLELICTVLELCTAWAARLRPC